MVMLQELHDRVPRNVDGCALERAMNQSGGVDGAGVVRYLELLRAMAAVAGPRSESTLS